MTILAIDTTSHTCSAALWHEGTVHETSQLAPREHTKLILPMVSSLLRRARIELNDIEAIAFSAGPGSFTGIRIASSVAKGLGFALNVPLLPISSLQVLAQRAFREFTCTNALVCIDARMRELYWGIFNIDANNVMQAETAENISSMDKVNIPSRGNDLLCINSGCDADTLAYIQQLSVRITEVITGCDPIAQDMLPMAQQLLAAKKTDTALTALPNYLRNDVIQTQPREKS